jgi:hypothetical protein
MMSKVSIYSVLNSKVVVDIYQLMELLVGQAIVSFSMDKTKEIHHIKSQQLIHTNNTCIFH